MRIKAIIFDLDNTVYSVPSIGDELFASLFALIEEAGSHAQDMDRIREDVMRIPFQLVAATHHFSEELTRKGMALLQDHTYSGKIEPFEDFPLVRELPVEKFLVTTGFLKLQQSKVKGMKLEQDFSEIHIVDPSASDRTKKDVFADILQRHAYRASEVLVVGDDLLSEIKAARELDMPVVLYDKFNRHTDPAGIARITHYRELGRYVS